MYGLTTCIYIYPNGISIKAAPGLCESEKYLLQGDCLGNFLDLFSDIHGFKGTAVQPAGNCERTGVLSIGRQS